MDSDIEHFDRGGLIDPIMFEKSYFSRNSIWIVAGGADQAAFTDEFSGQ